MKEALRRREWGHGKDEMAAAALPWPVFPRNSVSDVLTTLLDEVIKIDEEAGGMFSVPVPKDDFPDYYELIDTPMDYGTMRKKLENGEYRSALIMQKDFVLIMQNCLAYNTKDSNIVKEAKRQTLMRPKLLKEAALKNNLFIHEDGSVIEIHNDAVEKKRQRNGKSPQKTIKKKQKVKPVACGECEGCLMKSCKKCDACKRRKRCDQRVCSNIKRIVISDEVIDEDEEGEKSKPKTPRITLRVGKSSSSKKRKATPLEDDDDEEEVSQSAPSGKRARLSNGRRSPAASEQSDVEEDEDGEMFDIEKLESKSIDVRKGSFQQARDNMTLHGPWHLPPSLASNEKGFREVAKITLANISKYVICIFADSFTRDGAAHLTL